MKYFICNDIITIYYKDDVIIYQKETDENIYNNIIKSLEEENDKHVVELIVEKNNEEAKRILEEIAPKIKPGK